MANFLILRVLTRPILKNNVRHITQRETPDVREASQIAQMGSRPRPANRPYPTATASPIASRGSSSRWTAISDETPGSAMVIP